MTERSWRDYLLLTPAVAAAGLLFLLPFCLLLVVSFWSVRSFQLRPDLTFDAYGRFVANYLEITLYTLAVGVVTAALCVVVGFVFAYAARFRAGRFADALILLTLVTLFGGYLVKIYAWKSILGVDGILNSILLGIGVIREPVTWFIFNRGAVVVALLNFLLPFAILPIYAALRNVGTTGIEAARDLGASGPQVLARVVLPQCRTGLLAAFAFCFLLAAGDYVTPLFLGGASGAMVGQFIAIEFSTRFNWPAGAAMSFGLLAMCLLVIAAFWLLLGRRRR